MNKFKIEVWFYLAALVLALFGHTLYPALALSTAIVIHFISHTEQKKQEGAKKGEVFPNEKEELERREAEESFSYRLDGETTVEVFPHCKRYEEQWVGDGQSTDETYEYEVRDTQVFARLTEKAVDSILSGKCQEVLRGQVLEDAITGKRPLDDLNTHYLNRMKTLVLWHEVLGPLRYFILNASADRNLQGFFASEQKRLSEAFSKADAELRKLGAVWSERSSYYRAPDGATPEVKRAVNDYSTDENLRKLGISFYELCSKNQTLDALNTITASAVRA